MHFAYGVIIIMVIVIINHSILYINVNTIPVAAAGSLILSLAAHVHSL